MHIVVGLIIAFALVAMFSRRKTRHCRWRMDRSKTQNGKTFYICMNCGASVFMEAEIPPQICHKP